MITVVRKSPCGLTWDHSRIWQSEEKRPDYGCRGEAEGKLPPAGLGEGEIVCDRVTLGNMLSDFFTLTESRQLTVQHYQVMPLTFYGLETTGKVLLSTKRQLYTRGMSFYPNMLHITYIVETSSVCPKWYFQNSKTFTVRPTQAGLVVWWECIGVGGGRSRVRENVISKLPSFSQYTNLIYLIVPKTSP